MERTASLTQATGTPGHLREGRAHGLDLSRTRWPARDRVGILHEEVWRVHAGRTQCHHDRGHDRKLCAPFGLDEGTPAWNRLYHLDGHRGCRRIRAWCRRAGRSSNSHAALGSWNDRRWDRTDETLRHHGLTALAEPSPLGGPRTRPPVLNELAIAPDAICSLASHGPL